MNTAEIERFRKMAAQLDALHQEMTAASKKSADKPVSAFKVKFANMVLNHASEVLGASAPELGFAGFDTDDLPTVSDVSFIVTQFVECSEKIRCENIVRFHNGVWFWKDQGEITNIATAAPKGVK